jgi:hypothetical protein
VWRLWTNRQRLLLLDAAEAVSHAESLRADRRLSAAARRRHQEIARLCVRWARDALRLAKDCPPPWREGSPVGDLILSLADFALSGLRETARTDERAALTSARLALLELERRTPHVIGHVPRQLVGRLAWLKAGKRPDLVRLHDYESTIRRLTKPRLPPVSPGAPAWRVGFRSLVALARLISASGHHLTYRTAPEIRKYLRGSRRT